MATGSSDALIPPSEPKPVGSPHVAGQGQWLSQCITLDRRRLALALALSLLLHTLLLTLTFGGYGLGLPGFGLPWQDRRIDAPALPVALVPAQVTDAEPAVTPIAQPLPQAQVERPVVGGLVVAPSVSPAPTPARPAAAIAPRANSSGKANPTTDAATGAAPAKKAPLRADRPVDTAPSSTPEPPVIALAPSDETTWVVPATPEVTAAVVAEP